MTWVPLHVHSQYSILNATPPVKTLAKKAAEMKIPALALTDNGNLFGTVEFYKACKGAGVKPIIGCELYVAPDSRKNKSKVPGKRTSYRLTLLAKNDEGYHNLCRLSSLGYLEGFYYYPRVDKESLKEYCKGLICFSGNLNSMIADAILEGTEEEAVEEIRWLHELFGEDFYFELIRHPMTEEALQSDGFFKETWKLQKYQDYINRQQKVNEALIRFSKEMNIPCIATNDSHYIDREDWYAHEILLNVQSGEPCEIWEKDSFGNNKFRVSNPKRKTYPSHEYDFKSPEQMKALFEDIPEAISNTLLVAEKCQVDVDFETQHYPVYVPEEIKDTDYTPEERAKAAEDLLRRLCEEGIPKRYTEDRLAKVKEQYPDQDPMDVVRQRLDLEMNIIVPKGMADYLLIVWDFIHWAKSHQIPVGPGRGSGAGSIILYLIGITDIEPLGFALFFERFINPERLSYPDIDVDICMDRRGDVISYTLEKYGRDNVAQIITFGTMKAKSTIKDVGRVLSVPLAHVNTIAKLVPDDLNITLELALEKDPDFRHAYDSDEDVKRIIDLGLKLEGSIRSTGIHAAGIIISGEPLTEYIPVCVAKDAEMPVTQYSMKPVEAVGMLKIDFLGLKTLTSIQLAVDAIKQTRGVEIDWMNLPFNNQPTFDMLNQGKTSTVFQLESGGMQDLARQLHLDRFEEIIAVGALYRPGPMDMIPSFIARKHGREPIEYDHPWMEGILKETYGIMVYQEQVMQIAQNLANYSLGEGDVLRRAMGKKEMAEMAKQREKFRLGALENQIDEETSMKIFDKMEKFAAYGFNKSHATAYGYLSYVTAFLKANYPAEWFGALMTCDRDDLTKVSKIMREAKTMQIEILPPDVNESGDCFVATGKGIRFALSAIRGIGSAVVEEIVKERTRKGPYKDFYDFFKRLDGKKVGKKAIENMVEAGAFDFTSWSRDAMIENIEEMYEAADKQRKEDQQGMMSLFAHAGIGGNEQRFSEAPKVRVPRNKLQIMLKEKEMLGLFLTGHPMDAYKEVLTRLSCIPIRKLHDMENGAVFRSAFIVETIAVRFSSKTQKKFAILTISDGVECCELPIWPELFEEKKHLLNENQLLYAVLRLERGEQGVRLSCNWIDDLTQADEKMSDECDQAYDKAKRNAAFRARGNFAAKSTKKEKSMPAQPKKIVIQLDADQTQMSHILKIRDLIASHHGEIPLHLTFAGGGKNLADLHLDPASKIEGGPKFEKALKDIHPSIKISN